MAELTSHVKQTRHYRRVRPRQNKEKHIMQLILKRQQSLQVQVGQDTKTPAHR